MTIFGRLGIFEDKGGLLRIAKGRTATYHNNWFYRSKSALLDHGGHLDSLVVFFLKNLKLKKLPFPFWIPVIITIFHAWSRCDKKKSLNIPTFSITGLSCPCSVSEFQLSGSFEIESSQVVKRNI